MIVYVLLSKSGVGVVVSQKRDVPRRREAPRDISELLRDAWQPALARHRNQKNPIGRNVTGTT